MIFERTESVVGSDKSLECLERGCNRPRKEESIDASSHRTLEDAPSWSGLALLAAECARAEAKACGEASNLYHICVSG